MYEPHVPPATAAYARLSDSEKEYNCAPKVATSRCIRIVSVAPFICLCKPSFSVLLFKAYLLAISLSICDVTKHNSRGYV